MLPETIEVEQAGSKASPYAGKSRKRVHSGAQPAIQPTVVSAEAVAAQQGGQSPEAEKSAEKRRQDKKRRKQKRRDNKRAAARAARKAAAGRRKRRRAAVRARSLFRRKSLGQQQHKVGTEYTVDLLEAIQPG